MGLPPVACRELPDTPITDRVASTATGRWRTYHLPRAKFTQAMSAATGCCMAEPLDQRIQLVISKVRCGISTNGGGFNRIFRPDPKPFADLSMRG
jgi:hypothetical protein